MTVLRVLHVDDEPDIREVVALSLSLDPSFNLRSCCSGADALSAVAEWPPDLILCDATAMDGPATLAGLRASPRTAHIPVVFTTVPAQDRELDHFKSLGATGVIHKPLDPATLAQAVRSHMRTAALSALRIGFLDRLQLDGAAFIACRDDLSDPETAPEALSQIKAFANALTGAAGVFGYHEVSRAAAALDRAIGDEDDTDVLHVGKVLDVLLAGIHRVRV